MSVQATEPYREYNIEKTSWEEIADLAFIGRAPNLMTLITCITPVK
jgi:hypothetical protein